MVGFMADPADIQRLLGDLAREGTIVSVDLKARTARVRFEDLVTGDIPWLMARAGKTRISSPPSVGEQVLVIAPEADTDRGIIIGSLSSSVHPDPADDGSTLIDFQDGARLSYDPEAKSLEVDLPAGATLDVTAETMILRGTVHVRGDLFVDRKVTAEGDVVGAGKSLKDHMHDKVQPGQGVSGKPL